MLGAIIGDIAGSIYEWNNIKSKDFPLFGRSCSFTDDTVMTCAVAEAIMRGGKKDDFIDAMKEYGRAYPHAGYGGRFGFWLSSDTREPYGSFGNGSAMRVSPCGWAIVCREPCDPYEVLARSRELAIRSAEVTHNHPEGIKGAAATADAIVLCRLLRAKGASDPEIFKRSVRFRTENEYGYDLSRTLDEIRPDYGFNETCQGSVPQAVTAFLESRDFEDAIRNAISLGGDSDTLAAITGGIAEAAWGIPEPIRKTALYFLDDRLADTVLRWEKFIAEK